MLQLLWEQDFTQYSSNELDPKIWNFEIGDGSSKNIPGWGNKELEYYIPECTKIENELIITATKEVPAHAAKSYYGDTQWVSSRFHTQNKVLFEYGRIEMIAKAATGGGAWPAVWLLGEDIDSTTWPECGEIDLFEGAGNRPTTICGTIHGPGYCADDGITKAIEIAEPIANEYHKYAIDWLPDQITWLFNDEPFFTIKSSDEQLTDKSWKFNHPFFMIVNLAMGGGFAGDVVPGFDQTEFRIKSIKHFAIDGVGTNKVIG